MVRSPVFWLLLFTISIVSAPSLASTLTIRADPWLPMNGDPNSDKPGYMIELAKAIFEPRGITVDYQVMPWSRALQQTREGRFDCVVGAYKSDARGFTFPEQHWGLDRPQFFVAADDRWRYSGTLSDLENRRVGVIADYYYEDAFDAYAANGKGLNFQYMTGSDPLKKNIEKFLARRIDTILESQLVMTAKLKQMGLTGHLKSAGDLIPPEPMYIACSPKLETSQQYVQWVDEATQVMKRDGRLKSILDRYGVPAWW